MKIYTEKSLKNVRFWGEGANKASRLTDDELDCLERYIINDYPDGISDATLNDLLAYEFEYICELLGLNINDVLDRPKTLR